MATINFVEDKIVTLLNRTTLQTEPFTIEAPNGGGVYEVDIKEDKASVYKNGKSEIRKKFTNYRIVLRFMYNNHNMELEKLLFADEISIPFSLDLVTNITKDFILSNEEVVKNFFANYPVESENYPHGSIELEFETVEPISEAEILSMTYYR